MLDLSIKKYISASVVVVILLVLFLYTRHFINTRNKLEELQSEETNWVRSEVTSRLINYQFAYLRPPATINELVEYLKIDLDSFPSKTTNHIINYLNANENSLRLSFDYKENFVHLYHIGFNGIDNKLQKAVFYPEKVNTWGMAFCNNYDFIMTYYEIPTKCLDQQYRAYKDNLVYTTYDNYDSLVHLFVKPIKRNWINDSGARIKFNAIININFIEETIMIEPCDSNIIISNSFLEANDLQNLMMEINWGNKPDSLYIPILHTIK